MVWCGNKVKVGPPATQPPSPTQWNCKLFQNEVGEEGRDMRRGAKREKKSTHLNDSHLHRARILIFVHEVVLPKQPKLPTPRKDYV